MKADSRGGGKRDRRQSWEDIHRAVFSRVPKRKTRDEMKAAVAERMRKEYRRR